MKYAIIGSSVKQENVLEIFLNGKTCAKDAQEKMAKTIFQDLMLESSDVAHVDIMCKNDMVSRNIVTTVDGEIVVSKGVPLASSDFLVVRRELTPFVVLYTTSDFNVPEAFQVNAVDSEDAEEKTCTQFPGCDITWVVETDSIETAFDVYHEESTMEDY